MLKSVYKDDTVFTNVVEQICVGFFFIQHVLGEHSVITPDKGCFQTLQGNLRSKVKQ